MQTAYRVLQQHPQVLGSRIAMLGLSLSTSFTLKMAVYSQAIKPVEKAEMLLLFVSEQVGQLQCPLLLVVGEDDQNWPTYESAMDMKEMMEQAGNSHLLTVLSYPNAGHLIEPPYMPLSRASTFISVGSHKSVMALWGGETVAHSRAQEDAWRKTLVFLRENLYGGMNPVATLFCNL
ncbi:peroxisomal succinyl-coenzyme A thioesterase-like [Morone saxatilis]|uniref:peroxisomal succinyl-coenzyme A thioesterase-like n=1 Tax=Morone saxatilis TaxID=34816 RepID=UPI0015E1B9DA|nr:peroxisomal succinyl-coenzyme A thioesterase-like [Morone saxatilis]